MNNNMNFTPIYSAKEADAKIEFVRKRDNKTIDKYWFKNSREAIEASKSMKKAYDLRKYKAVLYIRTTDRTWYKWLTL